MLIRFRSLVIQRLHKFVGVVLLVLWYAGPAGAATFANPTGIGCTLNSGTTYDCGALNLASSTDFSGSTLYTLNVTGTVTLQINVTLGTATNRVNVVSTGNMTLNNNTKVYGDLTVNSVAGTITLSNSANTRVFGNTTATTISIGNAAAVTGSCTYTFCSSANCPAKCGSTSVVKSNQATLTVTAPASVTFGTSGTLTSSGGSGTGAVTYDAGASTGCSVAGTALSVTDATGTCTVTATKAADTNYNAATSAAFTVTLVKRTQTITFNNQSPTSQTYAPAGTFSVNPVATTTSALTIDYSSTTPGVCTVSGATVTIVSVGTCTVAANQAGNNNNLAAAQVTRNVTINKAAQTITFGAQPTPLTYSPSGTFLISPLATTTSGLAIAYTSTTAGVCSVSGTTVTIITAGTCTIAANQAGDTNYNAATQVTQSVVIGRATQATLNVTGPASVTHLSPGTLTSSGGSGAGALTYSRGATTGCTVAGTTISVANVSLTCIITVTKAADTNYNATTSAPFTVTLNKADQTITFPGQTTTSRFLATGTTFAIAPLASASSALAITYSSLTSSICTVSGTTVTMLLEGTCTVAANQAGNATLFNAAPQATQSVTINSSFMITGATVNGTSSVTVAQGIGITVAYNVNVLGGVALKGTRWEIGTTAPNSPATCENTVDTAAASGSYAVTPFVVFSPPSAGTYNLYLMASSLDTCAGTRSPLFILPNAVTVVNVPPIAEYRFDECFLTGAAGEVRNSIGAGYNGKRLGTTQTILNGRVNRGVTVPNNTLGTTQDVIDTTIDLNTIGTAGTIAFWYKSNLDWVGGGVRTLVDATNPSDKYFALNLLNDGSLRFFFEDVADTDFTASTPVLPFTSNDWVHIAMTWSYLRDRMEIIVNGVLRPGFSVTSLGALPDFDTVYIGDNHNKTYRGNASFNSGNGTFDEVMVWASVLSPAQLTVIKDNQLAGRTWDGVNLAPVVCIDHYQLVLPSSSINCMPTNLTVTACADSSSPCTNPYTGAIGATAALATTGGVLGATTLTFDATGVAATTLSYPTAPNATATTVTLSGESIPANTPRQCCPNGANCVVANSCSTTFNTAGFIISTAPGGPVATVGTQVAGTTAATHYLRAVQSSTTTAACAAALTGPSTVDWAYECKNPTVCSSANLMSVNGGAATTVQRNNNGAALSYTAAVPMTFDASGNAPFTFNYSDVGQVTLWATKVVNAATLTGSSNAYVTKPAGFTVAGIKQTAAPQLVNPAAASAAGAKFLKAGEPFTATVTATTSTGAAAPNYGKETSPEGVLLTHTLVLPSPGNAGTVSNATIAGGSFSNGVATLANFAYDEVGIITLTPVVADGDYLGTVASGAVVGTTTGNIGRFYPDHFAITAGTVAPACATGAFTYFGQDGLTTPFTLTAQNLANGTTQNYKGGFAKLALTTWGAAPASSGAPGFGFSAATLPAGSVLSASATPPSGTWGAGTTNVVAKHVVRRPTALTGITALTISAAPVDSDGVAMTTTPLTAASNFYYGRLRMLNAYGSELLALPMSLTAQYWNGTGFVTNVFDSCSTLNVPTASSGMVFGVGNLSAGETIASIQGVTSGSSVLLAGDAALRLSKPGSGNNGYLDITINAPTWLQFPWTSAAMSNPTARATFGIYKSPLIYRRENY